MKFYLQSIGHDSSTNEVMEWLYYLGQRDIIRFNNVTEIRSLEIELSDTTSSIKLNNHILNGNFFYWYRRGKFIFYPKNINRNINKLQKYYKDFYEYQKSEISDVISFIAQDFLYCEGKSINKREQNDTNKLSNLYAAKKCGISIPHTKVVSSLTELKAFASIHAKIITKPVKFSFVNINTMNKKYSVFFTTKVFTLSYINSLLKINTYNEEIYPTLIQEYIEKKYEIRVFYTDNSFYPMCIFSQANSKTREDFRNYDFDRPNRFVPFRFEKSFISKLKKFASLTGIKSGSIDIVVNSNNDYIFLEVNPIGQFQWLSKNCNYFIEKQLAKYYYEQNND